MQLLVPDALLVTIFLGANDAVLPDGTSSRQYVALADFRRNIAALVAAARGAGARHIVLITPPPVDEAARVAYNKELHGAAARDTAERSNANTGQYAAACAEVQPQPTRNQPVSMVPDIVSAHDNLACGFYSTVSGKQ